MAPMNTEIVCLLQRVRLEYALQCGENGSLNQFTSYSLDEPMEPLTNLASDLANINLDATSTTAAQNTAENASFSATMGDTVFHVKDTAL